MTGHHRPNPAGAARTVAGDVIVTQLGAALTHEHVLVDLSAYYEPDPDERVARELDRGVRIEMLGLLRRSLVNCLDDLCLDDDNLAVQELRRVAEAGGSLVVDLSSHGIRQPDHARRLRAIADRAGVLVVLGTGAYVERHHPDRVRSMSRRELAELFVSELIDGVGDPGVRCGAIGEIGLSTPPTARELVVLEAACDAAIATGFPVVVHQTDPAGEVAIQAVRSLTARGLTPDRIVVAHAAAWPRHETFHAVLDTGCLIAVDTLGLHGSLGPVELPSFRGYLDLIVRLVDDGFADQVLVSQDVAHKRHLRAYGGVGYDHVLVDVAPRLRSLVGSKTVETILTDNPRRLLERIPCAA